MTKKEKELDFSIESFSQLGLSEYQYIKHLKLELFRPIFEKVKREMDDIFGINIFAKTRTRKYVMARQFFIRYIDMRYNSKEGHGTLTSDDIGKLMGLTHATIIHARHGYINLSQMDRNYREEAISVFFRLDNNLNIEAEHEPLRDELISFISNCDGLTIKRIYSLFSEDMPIAIQNYPENISV
jgi:hypothetical protein